MSVPQQQLPPGQQQYPYPAAGQPTFAMQQITPGAVAYYPQSQPGAPQMVVVSGQSGLAIIIVYELSLR